MVITQFLFQKELVCKLSEGINCIEGNIKVVVLPNVIEMLAQILPDLLPNETDPAHIEVCNLYQFLQ